MDPGASPWSNRIRSRAHGRDERIRIENFYEGQEFLYRLAKALSAGGIA